MDSVFSVKQWLTCENQFIGVVHGLEHGQGASPTGLAIICGESGITVQSVPGPTPGQALPKELSVCNTREEIKTAWDLGPGTLCCRARTWTNISSNYKIQRNYK